MAVLALIGGQLHEAGAGSKWWKRGCGGCGGCYAPVGCSTPYYGCGGCATPYSYGCSGCSTPFAYGCGGCSMPSCGLPMGYQPTYAMPYTGAPMYPQASPYQPAFGGGCGCAYGGARLEYNPYVYQPNPYVNTWGVGAPINPTPNVWTIGGTTQTSNPGYNYGAAPLMSAYNAPVPASMPAIPPMPPAEDFAW